MSKEIDNRIIQFMESELPRGHFEHTLREISKGSDLSYNDVVKSVERLETRSLISSRNRGTKKKPVPYYYIFKLKEILGNREGKATTIGKRNIVAKNRPDSGVVESGGDE